MDAVLVRTFLEVVYAGSFVRAAESLHVTQAAVTARIRSLEDSMGARLFVRNRAGASLTPEGERFLPYANTIISAWGRARQSIAIPEGHTERLRLGSEATLWNPLLTQWVSWLEAELPEVAVDASVAEANDLNRAMEEGHLDAVILHRPNYFAGCCVEQLLEEKLIRVQSPLGAEPDIYIDWGRGVEKQYLASLASREQSAYSFNFGPAALQFMLTVGGNGWFRSRVVQPYLDNGRLIRMPDSDEFTYPIFLAYRSGRGKSLDRALKGLREVSAINTPWFL
jgi:DNA-binding transcriptional LysR family regulator